MEAGEFGLVLSACGDKGGVIGSGACVARFHIELFENLCNKCRLADGDGGGCAVQFPSKEVTDGAEVLDSVAGGKLGPGGIQEGTVVADGEEIVDGDEEEDEVVVTFTSEHECAAIAGEASEMPYFEVVGETGGEYFACLFCSVDVSSEYTNVTGVFL